MNTNEFYHRKTVRLKRYDYSQSGFYYVTACTHNRKCLFGNIVSVGKNHTSKYMQLNGMGKIVEKIWESLSNRFPIELEEFQIVPNHIHMIVNIVGAHHDAPLNHNVMAYKRAIRESPLQQTSQLNNIRQYIINNPKNWEKDENNPNLI